MDHMIAPGSFLNNLPRVQKEKTKQFGMFWSKIKY